MVVLVEIRPVLARWTTHVVGPFGGIDAQLQAGLVEWSRRTCTDPGAWYDLPIFHPVPGVLALMDSLVGQALLVAPLGLLGPLTLAAQYNFAYLGTLVLAGVAMTILWMAGGGRARDGGIAVVAFVGSPYALAQLGHLNQMPLPWLLFAMAALLAALGSGREGRSPSPLVWWFLAASLVAQAAWGWYGFGYAVVASVVLGLCFLVSLFREGRRQGVGPAAAVGRPVARMLPAAVVPLLLAAAGVAWLAQPYLRMGDRYPVFQRAVHEVSIYSADLPHLLHGGAYRVRPADLVGRGPEGADRYLGRDRQVLNPGWIALALATFGFLRRRELSVQQRRAGVWLLAVGAVGLVLAFGDSVGLPGTTWRLPLPLEWLRQLAPPFKAFRMAWRFSVLLTIAVAWWAAAGWKLLDLRGAPWTTTTLKLAVALLLVIESVPYALPSVSMRLDGAPAPLNELVAGPLLTLPAPATEQDEDATEALWLAWALETDRAVTGGASGWVPPEVGQLRRALRECEEGGRDVQFLLNRWRTLGTAGAAVALRPGDEARIAFWRGALEQAGARRLDTYDRAGYEVYRWEEGPSALR